MEMSDTAKRLMAQFRDDITTQCGMIMLLVTIDHLLCCNVDAIILQRNCFGTLCQAITVYISECRN